MLMEGKAGGFDRFGVLTISSSGFAPIGKTVIW